MARLGVEVHGFDAAPVIAGIKDPMIADDALDLLSEDMSITTLMLFLSSAEATYLTGCTCTVDGAMTVG